MSLLFSRKRPRFGRLLTNAAILGRELRLEKQLKALVGLVAPRDNQVKGVILLIEYEELNNNLMQFQRCAHEDRLDEAVLL